MSQLAAGQSHGHDHGHGEPEYITARSRLKSAQVVLERGATSGIAGVLGLLGVACVIATVFGAFSTGDNGVKHALMSYHIGVLLTVGFAVGSLALVMIFQQFNAGWSAALRRQAENIASRVWVCALLFAPVMLVEVFLEGKVFKWLNPGYSTPGNELYDVMAEHKAPWLSPLGWIARAVIYFTIWIVLSNRLLALSREQDETGDRWLTAKARKLSALGLPLMALSLAFASFDWLMSIDYHWFSTMFGVQFFAGSVLSAVCLITVILALLRLRGKLEGVVTREHFHDTGKLLFAFTVFWAYVTFCQYFLIWYSNIPEETAFYNVRLKDGWENVRTLLMAVHFVIPFLLLLWRGVKRDTRLIMAMAFLLLFAHAVDIYYTARPNLKDVGLGSAIWLDVLGILGPVCLFLSAVAWQVGRIALVPLKDPRLHEALNHKNYV